MDEIRRLAASTNEAGTKLNKRLISEPILQLDSPIMVKEEADAKIVNKCGRTTLDFVDMGANLLNASANGDITEVRAAGEVDVDLLQINQDGGGPFTATMDLDGVGAFNIVRGIALLTERKINMTSGCRCCAKR